MLPVTLHILNSKTLAQAYWYEGTPSDAELTGVQCICTWSDGSSLKKVWNWSGVLARIDWRLASALWSTYSGLKKVDSLCINPSVSVGFFCFSLCSGVLYYPLQTKHLFWDLHDAIGWSPRQLEHNSLDSTNVWRSGMLFLLKLGQVATKLAPEHTMHGLWFEPLGGNWLITVWCVCKFDLYVGFPVDAMVVDLLIYEMPYPDCEGDA